MSTKAQKNESPIGTTCTINLILLFTLTFFVANSFIVLFLPQAASALTTPPLLSLANNAQIRTTSTTFTWSPYNDLSSDPAANTICVNTTFTYDGTPYAHLAWIKKVDGKACYGNPVGSRSSLTKAAGKCDEMIGLLTATSLQG